MTATVFLVMEMAEHEGESTAPVAVYASRELAENAVACTLLGSALFEIMEFVVQEVPSTAPERNSAAPAS